MEIEEIRIEDLDPGKFIEQKVQEISAAVGSGLAINALSGGVDSSAVTMLGYRALGERLKTYFIENGLMRHDEPQKIVEHFRNLGAIRDDMFPLSVKEWFNGFQIISPVTYVAGISPRPLLLVHGSQDDVVPVTHAEEMYAQAGQPRELEIVDGAGHRLRQDDRAMAIVIDWLKRHAQLN